MTSLVLNFSQKDLADLTLYEGKIVEGFREVAIAFSMIRDRRLYRINGYSSFDEYCRNRWGYSDSTVGRIIEAARLCDSFEEIVTELPEGRDVPMPTNEAQCRSLRQADSDEESFEIWDRVLELKGGDPDKVTSPEILDEVRRVAAEKRDAIPVGSIVRVNDPEGLVNFNGHKGCLTSYKGVGTIAYVDVKAPNGSIVAGIPIPLQFLELVHLPEPAPTIEEYDNGPLIEGELMPSDSELLERAIALIRVALEEGLEVVRRDMEALLNEVA